MENSLMHVHEATTAAVMTYSERYLAVIHALDCLMTQVTTCVLALVMYIATSTRHSETSHGKVIICHVPLA